MLVVVAGGVASAAHVEFIIFALLGVVAGHVAFALLAHYIADDTLAALEVISDGVRLVGGLPILEHRASLDGAQRVFHAMGGDGARIHIHADDVGCQFDLLIVHLTLTVEMSPACLGKEDGVVGLVGDGGFEGLALAWQGVGLLALAEAVVR